MSNGRRGAQQEADEITWREIAELTRPERSASHRGGGGGGRGGGGGVTVPKWLLEPRYLIGAAFVLGVLTYGILLSAGYSAVEGKAKGVDVFAEISRKQPLVKLEKAADASGRPNTREQEFRFLMERMRIGDPSKLKEDSPTGDTHPYKLIYELWDKHYQKPLEASPNTPPPTTVEFLVAAICDGSSDARCTSSIQEKGARSNLGEVFVSHIARTPCGWSGWNACSSLAAKIELDGTLNVARTGFIPLTLHWRPLRTPDDDALVAALRVYTRAKVGEAILSNLDTRTQHVLREKFLTNLIGEIRSSQKVRSEETSLVLVRGIEQLLILICSLATLLLILRRRLALRGLSAAVGRVAKIYDNHAPLFSTRKTKQQISDAISELLSDEPNAVGWLVARIHVFRLQNKMETLGELRESKELIEEAVDSHHRRIDFFLDVIAPIGFLGTVLGIMAALNDAGAISAATDATERTQAITLVAGSLGLAFATTAVALIASLLLGRFQRSVENTENSVLVSLESRLTEKLHAYQPAAPANEDRAPAAPEGA